MSAHGMTVETYMSQYPDAPLMSQRLANTQKKLNKAPQHPPGSDELTVDFAGIKARVNTDVPASDCLQLPHAYRIPVYGELKNDIREAALCLHKRRATYVWGLPGSGKDALFHAWCAYTRTPSLIFQVEPSADIRAWFFSHEFNKDGTYWAEGDLLKALRDGYTTQSGRVIPYLILITDFDRSTKEQAESLRLVLDSIQGRVKGPGGITYDVMKGTQIVVTANTQGGGDARGRCISSNVIDASILDRFERALEFHWMDWQDEEPIVKLKFPLLAEKCGGIFHQVGEACKALRSAIKNEDIYAEFSHRGLCSWLGMAEDIVETSGVVPQDLLRRSFRVFADKLTADDRAAAIRCIDPYLKGGAIPTR